MPRRTPIDRLDRLVDVATAVFIERGYRRTQMADVARAWGAARGPLSRAGGRRGAWSALAARSAAAPPRGPPLPLPLPPPEPGATLRFVREELTRQQAPRALTEALARPRVRD